MSFVLEVSKTGKDTILFGNHRYRESYTVKCGDVVWRCLGKSCRASIKSNSEKTAIFSAVDTHSGPHPVTMRSLTPTPPHKPIRPSAVNSANLDVTKPPIAPASCPDDGDNTSGSSISSPQSKPTSASVPTAASTPETHGSSILTDLETENIRLKDQLAEVEERLRCVLDHAVESDTRLLEYTDQIFQTKTRQADSSLQASRSDSAVQCDIQQRTCQSCLNLQELVTGLRTTIEVLEAEVKCLGAERKELEFGGCTAKMQQEDWILSLGRKPTPVHTQNRFSKLADEEREQHLRPTHHPHPHSNKIHKRPTKDRNGPRKNVDKLPQRKRLTSSTSNTINTPVFTSLQVKGDSHSRHLAGLLQKKAKDEFIVSGMCKPGAGLMSVSSGAQPPPQSCTVLIAGTNDVAEHNSKEIYKHIEKVVTSLRTPYSSVIVSTLPIRHDLPAGHPIHRQTLNVNNYIEKVCARYDRVQLLNFNLIGRRYFTTHGMHLRMAGKKLLAGLIMACMKREAAGSSLSAKHSTGISSKLTSCLKAVDTPPSAPTPKPRSIFAPCQQLVTYAEATMSTNLPTQQSQEPITTLATINSDSVFLGTPLTGIGQN